MKSFQCYSSPTCIDVSMDSKLVAIGSRDGTVRTWNLDTGKLVAGSFKCADPIGAIRFPHDSKKLAVDSLARRYLAVRDMIPKQVNSECVGFGQSV